MTSIVTCFSRLCACFTCLSVDTFYASTLHTILIRHHLCYENHYAACDLAVAFLFLYVVLLATLVVLLLMPYAV